MIINAFLIIPPGQPPPLTICGYCTGTIFPGNGDPTAPIALSLCQPCADAIDRELSAACDGATEKLLSGQSLSGLFD